MMVKSKRVNVTGGRVTNLQRSRRDPRKGVMEFDEFGVDEGVGVMRKEMSKVDGRRGEGSSAELMHV